MPSVLDYSDRQSKLVTRRILVAALKRLQAVDQLSNYAYVGFGAYQFLDFDLVHRHLGVKELTSIESDEDLLARCHFNAPYKGISILHGTATTMIPTLDWNRRAIVWLDYTQRLREAELADCENVALRLTPGSVLAVTLNCHPGRGATRRDDLAKAVGAANVPIGMSNAKLGEWGLAKVQRNLLTSRIDRVLGNRGDLGWQQILNINYKDSARMQLIVGVVTDSETHEALQMCRFEDMPEASPDGEALEIEIPNLTVRERQALSKKLPAKKLKGFAGLAEEDLARYAQFYRWLDPVI